MKDRFKKLGSKTKMIAGALALVALMAVNVQVGMNDGSTGDIGLSGLEATMFAPSAVATGGGTCYARVFQSGEETCWICSTVKSNDQCTTDCGSAVCF